MDRLELEIKRRAALFCADNSMLESLLIIETAMMIGAQVGIEDLTQSTDGDEVELLHQLFTDDSVVDPISDEVWHA